MRQNSNMSEKITNSNDLESESITIIIPVQKVRLK